jgi:hypothetical protein
VTFESAEAFQREYAANLVNGGVFVVGDELLDPRARVQVKLLFRFCGKQLAFADQEDLSKVEAAVLDLARAGFTVRRIVDFIPEPDSEIYRALGSLSDRSAISF